MYAGETATGRITRRIAEALSTGKSGNQRKTDLSQVFSTSFRIRIFSIKDLKLF